MSKNVNVSFEPDDADEIRRQAFLDPSIPVTQDFPSGARHGWLHLYPGVYKTPLEAILFEYSNHKQEFWELLGKIPLHEDRLRLSSQEVNDWVKTHTADFRVLCDNWKYGQAPSNLNPQAKSYWLWADDWTGFKIGTAITFNNTTGLYSLREVPIKMRTEYFDAATIRSTIANMICHFAVSFSDADIPAEVYGHIRPQDPNHIFVFKTWKWAVAPDGHIRFGSDIRSPMQKVNGLWRPEPIMEYVNGEADYKLRVPESIQLKLQERQDVNSIIGLNSSYGPMLIYDDIRLREKFPDRPPLITPDAMIAGWKRLGVIFRRVIDAANSVGVPFARFTRNVLYLEDDLKVAWTLEPTDPIIAVFHRSLLEDDPVAYFRSLTHHDMAKLFLNDVMDTYRQFYAIEPDAPRFTAPASGYNRYFYPAAVALGANVSGLPHVLLQFPPEDENFDGTVTGDQGPTRYGEHVYSGPA